jgi:excisionase family DNA binding protein
VNLKSAARQLGVHYQTAYRWVRSGQLVAIKVGAGYEVSDAALSRFEAQRCALERLPEPTIDRAGTLTRVAPTRAESLAVLDHMIDALSLEPGPVAQRAARYAAEVLGDAAIVSLRAGDGDMEIAAIAHRNPVAEVTVAAVAREVPFTAEVAQLAMRLAFERVRSGELDYRTVDARPAGSTAPIQMQVAVVRRADATPWCTLAAAHFVPQLAARPAGD